MFSHRPSKAVSYCENYFAGVDAQIVEMDTRLYNLLWSILNSDMCVIQESINAYILECQYDITEFDYGAYHTGYVDGGIYWAMKYLGIAVAGYNLINGAAAIGGSGAVGSAFLSTPDGQVFSVEIGAAGEATLESVVTVVSGGIIAAIISENIAWMVGGNGGDWKNSVDKGKGDSETPTVDYKGEERPVYRGGDDFTVKNNEIKINPETGNVKTSHGVSLDVNSDTVSKFGGAYKIESLPDG